ncbi:MAG: hypothetical protein ACHQYR_02320 [Candidatus Gagatemarchaeaceae archaeon]
MMLPAPFVAHAQGVPKILVDSQYTLDRYGFAVVNETVKFTNNQSSAITIPPITIGFGDLSSKIAASNFTGSGFQVTSSPAIGSYTVGGGQSLAAGSTADFILRVLLSGVTSTAKNGSLEIQVLTKPSLDTEVSTLQNVVRMPGSTQFASAPSGLSVVSSGTNVTYAGTQKNVAAGGALVVGKPIRGSATQDFHPLAVYFASRTISVGPGGDPTVTDSLTFKNLGTTALAALAIAPLTTAQAHVTVIPAQEPRLLNPTSVPLSSFRMDLTAVGSGSSVAAGGNYTIEYEYPLLTSYYTVTGGQVTVDLPDTPPIAAFVGSYSMTVSAPAGVRVLTNPPQTMLNVTPWQAGKTQLSYALSVAWAVNAGIPAASAVFVILLLGLFVSRTTLTEEEETEEESSTELASTMITAFEEKTSLINGLWPEIASVDPNELNKEYFDELRGRLDSFRSRSLQRLNEVKQKSTSQKFFELLNQIHTTEREVERAAKDKLNLYEQFYMRRMRKEVFDRLLPQYTKRLERALNQLSDELHVVQREAKLL